MKNRDLIGQCLITFVMVVIMGVVLLSTYDVPRLEADKTADVIAGAAVSAEETEYSGIIRLHVIANSDSDEDQALKLEVRNAIISQTSDLSGEAGIEESRKWIESHLDDLKKTAEDVIAENGCNYSVSAELGVRWIPEKTYGDMHFPAGNYEALTITIGEGEGENWWCVLFPPLCLITDDEAEMEKRGLETEDQIKVKSWLKEVLEKR